MYQYNVDQSHSLEPCHDWISDVWGVVVWVDDHPVGTAEWVMAPVVDTNAPEVAMD